MHAGSEMTCGRIAHKSDAGGISLSSLKIRIHVDNPLSRAAGRLRKNPRMSGDHARVVTVD
jgi:hypothetical protein